MSGTENSENSDPAGAARSSDTWLLIGDVHLVNEDHDILITDTEWLTDNIIDASQSLLKRDYPEVDGLHKICVLESMWRNSPDKLPPFKSPFVQILLENNNHWCVASNLSRSQAEVCIYDSKADSCSHPPKSTIEIVLRMLPQFERVSFFVEQVTQQVDDSQCGCMAIAYAKALCSGRNPADIQFSDDPRTLRDHILKCLQGGRIRSFPTGSKSPIARFEVYNEFQRADL